MSVADKYKKQRDEQTALVAELRAQLAEAERERDELLRIINKPNTLTCVYCGHEYPPGSPTHGASVLTEHIKACPQHPMRAAEARAAAAMALLKRVGESCDLSLNYATFPIHLWRELRAAFYDDAALAGNGPSGPKALSVDAAADERMERLRAAQPKEQVSRLSAQPTSGPKAPDAATVELAARALWTIGNARIGFREWENVGHHYLYEAEAALRAAAGLPFESSPPPENPASGPKAPATSPEEKCRCPDVGWAIDCPVHVHAEAKRLSERVEVLTAVLAKLDYLIASDPDMSGKLVNVRCRGSPTERSEAVRAMKAALEGQHQPATTPPPDPEKK